MSVTGGDPPGRGNLCSMMLNLVQPRVDVETLVDALPRSFPDLPAGLRLLPGAGTGNRSFVAFAAAESPPGDSAPTSSSPSICNLQSAICNPPKGWFVRVRNPKYAAEEAMLFERDLLAHLRDAGLPAYPPLFSADGRPWAWIGNACVQVSPLVTGEEFATGNAAQVAETARFLSRLHRESRRFLGDPRKQWDREDSYMVAFAGFDLVRNRDAEGRYTADLNAVATGIHRFMRELPPQRFWTLPQSVVHGDFHQGNLLFHGDALAGVFDWDYACEHPRLKDLANALMFLCTVIPRPLDAGDIRTYVQPRRFEPAWVAAFLDAYEEGEPLTPGEWAALPAMMVGRWLQIRSCAIIKLPEAERLGIFCEGMAETLDRLWSFTRP